MNTGPHGGVSAAATASSIRPLIWAVVSAVAANFVSGSTNGM